MRLMNVLVFVAGGRELSPKWLDSSTIDLRYSFITSSHHLYQPCIYIQSGFNQFSIIFVKMNITEDNVNKIKDLCLKHKVKELYLFGSALSDSFKPISDIDFLVEFSGVDLIDYFDNFMDFKSRLELLLGRNVDLVENQAIKNPIFRRSVDKSKQLIYGREIA